MKLAKNIDPKLKTIGEYLKLEDLSKFIIPEYQRAYKGQSKDLDD